MSGPHSNVQPREPSTGLVDLVVAGSVSVETMDGAGVPGGWVAIHDGFVAGVGRAGTEPNAA
ncbi:MAG TPA: hypothetical protein VEJ84_24195, partial [Acidimicrobiales bacterium]|nr:hypothetical protein [Acidimicrobiales bacterium]